MEFSADEIERYARHLVLPDVGGPGQQRLKRSRVLVIGAGGLGVPVITYAAAAGVGRLGIADHDGISLSNLHRQVLYASEDIGRSKVEKAAAAVGRLNPNVAVDVLPGRVSGANIEALIADYDIVADCTDSAEGRYVVSDACFRARKPLVSAAVIRMDGLVTTLKPFAPGPGGTKNPTYHCLFPRTSGGSEPPACAELGVLGIAAGVVGSIQAAEVIKEAAGIGSSLVGRMLLVDIREMRFESVTYRWDPANPLTGAPSGDTARGATVNGAPPPAP
ncbi:MAG: HesA/MoeB/ThiF family protein [Bauldia sp.]|nr:HesA/MoeB/ThiF family protein [Bauldia sp.]